MKPVKNRNVYPIYTDLWVEGDGPIGRSQMIDEVLETLVNDEP
jgi:ABC-type Fe3+-hydroxamate transport system substrate-binding protein